MTQTNNSSGNSAGASNLYAGALTLATNIAAQQAQIATNDLALVQGNTMTNIARNISSTNNTTGNAATATRATNAMTLGTEVSVKAAPYNAAGDGVTDDTVAFSRALTNAIVFVPAGTYIVGTNSAIVSNSYAMHGEPGAVSIIKFKTGQVGSGDSYLGNFLFKNTGYNSSYEDLVFDGQESSALAAAQSGTTNSEPRNTTVERNGVFLSESPTNGLSSIRRCVFRNFKGHGVFVRGDDNAMSSRNNRFLVSECSFTNNYQGILTSDGGTADYTRLENNFFWKNYIGWEFRGGNVTFVGNQFTDNYEAIYGNSANDGRSRLTRSTS
jgi:hypothetical protein